MNARQRSRQQPQPRKWPSDVPKPKLPMRQLPIYRVHYQDLEAFLERVYRMREFKFLMATGGVNGLTYEYDVKPELPPAWNTGRRADQIRLGNITRDVPLILAVLCVDGFIPPGRYIIDTRLQTVPIDAYRQLIQKTGDILHPDCIRFRQAHANDPTFTRQANLVDQAVITWQKENGV